MRQRIIAVSLIFIVGAVYLLQWHSFMPEFSEATMQDHFRHPFVLAALLGYLLCKTEKPRWQYSLLLAVVELIMITVKLFVLHTPFIVLDIVLLPMLMFVFYKYYFDWLLSIEIRFSELQQKIQESTAIDETLLEQYRSFLEQRKENMNQFQIRYFLCQEKELLIIWEALAQFEPYQEDK